MGCATTHRPDWTRLLRLIVRMMRAPTEGKFGFLVNELGECLKLMRWDRCAVLIGIGTRKGA